jgi:hypothetical protein
MDLNTQETLRDMAEIGGNSFKMTLSNCAAPSEHIF